jgi:hypothetical protein
MATDVMKSFMAITTYLDARCFVVIPTGIYLHIVDNLSGEIMAVCDTIEEVGSWVEGKFGINLIEEDVCKREITPLTLRSA